MTDIFTKKKRSDIMSQVRSKETKPELKLKKTLIGTYIRYQPKGILGRPDFGSKKHKIAIFVDSCFWHGCPIHYRSPKSHKTYWIPKIDGNKKRDRRITKKLKKSGYKVIRIWEHHLKTDLNKYASMIKKGLKK